MDRSLTQAVGVARVVLAMLIGLTAMAFPVVSVLQTLHLGSVGFETTITEVHGGDRVPGVRFQDHWGHDRRCRVWGAEVGDPIRYDATTCRPTAYIGLPSPDEWLAFGVGGLLLLGGAWFFLVGDRDRAPAEGATGPDGFPPPPFGVSARQVADGVELRLPWRTNLNGPGVVLSLLFTGVVAAIGTVAWPAIVVAAWLAYNTLYNLVNRTVVRVDGAGLDIVHGPLPSFERPVRIPWVQVGPLTIDAKRAVGQDRVDYYVLRAGSAVLLNRWNHEETLAYVKACAQRVHSAS